MEIASATHLNRLNVAREGLTHLMIPRMLTEKEAPVISPNPSLQKRGNPSLSKGR